MKKEISLSLANRIINHGSVVLVTSQIEKERPNIITVAWVTPVSKIPPFVAVSIGETRYSHRLILESGEFVVNVPSAAMASEVMFCGKNSGRDVDKFEDAHLTTFPAEEVNPPLIEECIGHLECRLDREMHVGDHSLFIGRVVKAWIEEGLFDDTWRIDRKGGEGLHHLGGNVFGISREIRVVKV